MARVLARQPDGTVLVEVSAEEARDLDVGARVEVRRADLGVSERWTEPFGAVVAEVPMLAVDDLKAARRASLH